MDSMSPEVIILEDELILPPTDFDIHEDDSLCRQAADQQNNTPTRPELPFLFHLIAQAVEYPQHLQHMLSTANPEDRALLQTFFVKVAAARKE